ncbi:MAG: hypothetical protein ACMG57_03860 [Candidatus Dojkabacteria bacterium]
MGRFLGKLFLTLLIIILVISTTALGVLFVVRTNDFNNSQNEITKIKADLKTAQDKIIELQAAAKDPNAKLTFKDTGLGAEVIYPASWTPTSKTDESVDSATGIVRLNNVELKLTKGTTVITFNRKFAAIGDIGVGYPAATFDIKVVNDKLIRVADKGSSSWSYKTKISCVDALDVPTGTDVCGTGSFFPGFGTASGSAGFASVDVKDTALLDEIDAIVASSLN